ncbi:MAG: hypothetical protein VX869_06620 [Chloroflexota bacterium]|nr:hypothetical protein [Chloroflexota bacterium]
MVRASFSAIIEIAGAGRGLGKGIGVCVGTSTGLITLCEVGPASAWGVSVGSGNDVSSGNGVDVFTFIGIGVAVTTDWVKTGLVSVGKTFTVSVELVDCPGPESPQADSIPEPSKTQNMAMDIFLIIPSFIVRQPDLNSHQSGNVLYHFRSGRIAANTEE